VVELAVGLILSVPFVIVSWLRISRKNVSGVKCFCDTLRKCRCIKSIGDQIDTDNNNSNLEMEESLSNSSASVIVN